MKRENIQIMDENRVLKGSSEIYFSMKTTKSDSNKIQFKIIILFSLLSRYWLFNF